MFRQDNTCPVLLFVTPPEPSFDYGAITRYGRTFQNFHLNDSGLWLTGLFPFRSPLLRESRLISFPKGT